MPQANRKQQKRERRGAHLDPACVRHEVQRLGLVPLSHGAAAEDEPERLLLPILVLQAWCQAVAERPRPGQRVVDVHLARRLDVGKLRRPPADGPESIHPYQPAINIRYDVDWTRREGCD